MKSYHRHQKQTRKQAHKHNRKKKSGKHNKKDQSAPSDKLKHLKAKRHKPKNSECTYETTNASLSTLEMEQLNDHIHEYLVFHGYDQTIYEFEKERISNSYTQIKLSHNLMNTNIINSEEMRNEILHKVTVMFDAKDINGVFKIWNRYLSKKLLNTNAYAIKLECHLHIFQFVTKITQFENKQNCIQNLNQIRSELQNYFNNNGQRLALCQSVLPYFSLPFIDNARTHPIFAQFYEPTFAQNLKSQMTGFILKSIDRITVPKLHSIFAIAQKIKTNSLFSNNETDNKSKMENIDNLTQILRCTSDFVNAMQYCLNNNLPPTTAMIRKCKQKMSVIAKDILNARKICETITDSSGDVPSVQYSDNTPLINDQNTLLNTIQNSVIPNREKSTNNIVYTFAIDYDKIQKQICTHTNTKENETKLLILLQSLRWRITKLTKHSEKRGIVSEYIRNDILHCNNIEIVSNLLCHSNIQIIETGLRLLNVISSFAIGRTYLLRFENEKMINILSQILTKTISDDSVRMNCLGVLQKLSLRKELQKSMIERGLIGFIIEMLSEELSDLSEYSIEYSSALLMNLTLRSKGKKECQLNEIHINKILNTLLKLLNSAFVAQIHTYVNGVLYSLLSEPCIHEIALKMDLKTKLNNCTFCDPTFKQQIDYIITLISEPLMPAQNQDESDEGSNEDYSENEDYQEFDVNELTQYLSTHKLNENDYILGEQFLLSEYQKKGGTNEMNVKTLQKPMTPPLNKQLILKKKEENLKYSAIFCKNYNVIGIENKDDSNVTPGFRNEKWLNDDEYRAVFEPKCNVTRTPPNTDCIKD